MTRLQIRLFGPYFSSFSTNSYGYVLKIDILTPPDSDGTYQPGTAVTFRLNQFDESGTLLHRNPNMAACNGCHTPMTFELDNIVLVRSHFIHSRSDRYDAPLSHCSSCHPEEESTRRTTKAACLSCHRSYPDSHIQRYGPIHSIYVGGKDESFDRCAKACHTSHPESGY